MRLSRRHSSTLGSKHLRITRFVFTYQEALVACPLHYHGRPVLHRLRRPPPHLPPARGQVRVLRQPQPQYATPPPLQADQRRQHIHTLSLSLFSRADTTLQTSCRRTPRNPLPTTSPRSCATGAVSSRPQSPCRRPTPGPTRTWSAPSATPPRSSTRHSSSGVPMKARQCFTSALPARKGQFFSRPKSTPPVPPIGCCCLLRFVASACLVTPVSVLRHNRGTRILTCCVHQMERGQLSHEHVMHCSRPALRPKSFTES